LPLAKARTVLVSTFCSPLRQTTPLQVQS